MISIPYVEIIDNIPGEDCDLDSWNSVFEGCKCGPDSPNESNDDRTNNEDGQLSERRFSCTEKTSTLNYSKCYCISLNRKFFYVDQKLNCNFDIPDWFKHIPHIIECNSECECETFNSEKSTCNNRLVQYGPSFELEIFDCINTNKGKGVRAKEFIPKGSFVIEYAGEIITEQNAAKLYNERSKLFEPNYIMYLREYQSNGQLFSTNIIDARNYANMARFINHSCEPNLLIVPVRINNLLPHAALFSLIDINIDEELSYDYNGSLGQNNPSTADSNEMRKIACLCGSSNCRGFLPNII